jgi:PAS domain S-box-containing protein
LSVLPNKNGAIKILAVDDNAAALYATARVLRSAGYEVLEASTGNSALTLADRADLVVLDINLPDIDGFEVCRRLRARPETAQLPVLHLSATFTQSSDFELGLEAGADSYLTRPVEAPVLLATVRTLLFARHADLIRRGLDAKLRSIYKLAPVAMAMTDPAICFESVNPAFCALTGYSSDELSGAPASTVFNEHMRIFEPRVTGVAEHANIEELNLIRRDGSTARVELRVAAESVSGARIIVMTDISYRLLAEQERETLLASERAARADAERSNRLKEEFLATISHELRNPLNAILGWATILGRTPNLAPEVKRAVQAIERNSRIQAQMIADLLDYAGITFGKVRLQGSTINPVGIVRAALDIVSGAAQARQIQWRNVLVEDEVLVEADPARLQQVAVNLLSNAVKFSAEGGIIEVTAAREKSSFRLSVRDYGKGISGTFLPHIFERFSQQDSSSTKSYGGLGLGLAIVKQLVDLHGGTIEVASDGEGQGATFTVTLPLSDKLPLPMEEDTQSLRSLDLSGVVALVVEDNKDARDLIGRLLTDAGARVIEASDAASAIERIRDAGANFLISDIGMAGKDGYALMRSLRAKGYGSQELPAIALTAFARAQDRADALAAGFQDHLAKPLDAPTLIARVRSLRRRKQPVPRAHDSGDISE